MLPKRRKGGYGIRPYGFWRKFYILPVGEDIILPCMTIPPPFSLRKCHLPLHKTRFGYGSRLIIGCRL